MCCCTLCYVSGTSVENPVNYYIKIQDLDNYIIQLYILNYVWSMKQISQLPDKNKEVVQRFGFFCFLLPCVVVMQGCDCREKNPIADTKHTKVAI